MKAGELGRVDVVWFTLNNAKFQPENSQFKEQARVASFANSGPARMLKQNGYKLAKETDDQNQLTLWLFEGKIDAILAMDFRGILSEGLQSRVDQLKVTHFKTFRMGFKISEKYHAKHPEFRTKFAENVKTCELLLSN